ncbi:MAG: metallophosphoesterase [Deltaproteobacteria bacterium]|nr:metallophosphoesterase [Deltaproteobacteria bacterium]MBW2397047.1 metallophosphoesterase [Deltaproteobacteria bacterium]
MKRWLVIGIVLAVFGPATRARTEGFFLQMADTQFGMFAKPLLFSMLGWPWNEDSFEEETVRFERAIDHANRLKPAFVVFCGDLVNTPGHSGQIAEFKRIAAQLDPSIPLHLIAGNHDIENEPTPQTLARYREDFGKDWYAFQHDDVYGIVLNSTILDEPDAVQGDMDAQMAWLKAELPRAQASGAKHILIFQHHPYFLEEPDESDGYFNIPIGPRRIYLDLFKAHGVRAVFAGHYHRNAEGRDGELEMITTSAVGRPLGDDPSGFRIVQFSAEGLSHTYYGLDEVPASVAR